MAQADSIITATHEMVSRGMPVKSTNLSLAHTERPALLAGKPLQLICLGFESEHLDSSGDLAALVSNTAQQIPNCLRQTHAKLFVAVHGDALIVIRIGPEDRDDENWTVS
jgi:hypothetical protein